MAQRTPTKRERREQARYEREMLLRQAARRRQLNRFGVGALLVVVVAAATALVLTRHKATATAGGSTQLQGIQTGPPPWAPEYAHLRQRLGVLGLPAGSSMATTLHHHDLVQIFVHGHAVTVPSQVGIDQSAGYLTSLHTHDASGIVHVESPTERSFTLGAFFDVWGVRLSSTCIGGYCDEGSSSLRAFVNGTAFTGDPRTVPLTQHEDIVLAYGTKAELPAPMPSTYSASLSSSCAPDC
jgi:hypothetical protein